jgi:CubicO group peptidase (beta-lactamase class C family)
MDDLLNHRAGWNRSANPNVPELIWRMREIPLGSHFPPTIDDFVYYLGDVPLDFAPGTGQVYSNIGYIALSKVVETVTGMSYFDYLKAAILTPLGLADSVKVWSSNDAKHIRERVTQESRYVGLSAEDPSSDEQVAFIFGGDGMHKETAVGSSALAASASTLVKFIANHGTSGPTHPT